MVLVLLVEVWALLVEGLAVEVDWVELEAVEAETVLVEAVLDEELLEWVEVLAVLEDDVLAVEDEIVAVEVDEILAVDEDVFAVDEEVLTVEVLVADMRRVLRMTSSPSSIKDGLPRQRRGGCFGWRAVQAFSISPSFLFHPSLITFSPSAYAQHRLFRSNSQS